MPTSRRVLYAHLQDHTAALDFVLQHLSDSYSSEIKHNMEAVGHRVGRRPCTKYRIAVGVTPRSEACKSGATAA